MNPTSNVNGAHKSNGATGRNELVQRSVEVEGAIRSRHPSQGAFNNNGWRAGRPEEDPEKMKKWGFISARPSEFLIHMRRGQVIRSGQGASCFKWPWDSVAVVPTTVQRLQFVADQITSEKVGVQVTGLAVYRISDPLIAFRMLNFSYPERAQQKLEELLVEMFVGAARRLVANLTVDACLSRRKEGIATELMKEIAPVVAGSGRTDDRTHKGWGVVLDTIEIQDVRVLSDTVFANLQAGYRNEQERKAKEAELLRERSVRQQEAEAQRMIALTQVSSESEIRERKQEAQEKAEQEALFAKARVEQSRLAQEKQAKQAHIDAERALHTQKLEAELELKRRRSTAEEEAKLQALQNEARLAETKLLQEQKAKQAQVELERQLQVAKLEAELEVKRRQSAAEEEARITAMQTEARLEESRVAHERAMAQARAVAELEQVNLTLHADAARHAAKLAEVQQEAERVRAEVEVATAKRIVAEAQLATYEFDLKKHQRAQELDLWRTKTLKEIDNTVSAERVQLMVAERLPELARAFQQKMGEVHVTSIDGANPFGYIAAAVEGVMGLARSAGLELPKKDIAPKQ